MWWWGCSDRSDNSFMTPADLTSEREKLGVSQAELSRALGLSRGAVSLWESGKRAIPPYLGLAIAELGRRDLSHFRVAPDKQP